MFVAERARRPAFVPRYFAGIVAEAFVYALVLAAVVGGAVGALFGRVLWPAAMAQAAVPGGLGMQLALSIGAGLYEELVFRVLLVGGLAWGLRRAASAAAPRALLVAAVVGALVFSGVHHLGPYGEPFTLSAFTFRFLFGLALNGVFLVARLRARGVDARALRRARRARAGSRCSGMRSRRFGMRGRPGTVPTGSRRVYPVLHASMAAPSVVDASASSGAVVFLPKSAGKRTSAATRKLGIVAMRTQTKKRS